MSWQVISLIAYFLVLLWHFLLSKGVKLPTGKRWMRVIAAISVVAISVVGCLDYLVRIFPLTLPTIAEIFEYELVHLCAVLVVWIHLLAALICCCLLFAHGRAVTLHIHVE